MMNINKELNGNLLTVKLEGSLDTLTHTMFEQDVIPDLHDIDTLVLDLEKLSYISSAGLRVLLIAQKKMETLGKMMLKNVNEEIMNVFEMTGFINFLNIE